MKRASPRKRRLTKPAAAASPGAELARGRAAYAQRAWRDAFEALSNADRVAPLDVGDLDRLAWSAGLAGRTDVLLPTLERLHDAHLEAGDPLSAARAAFWLGFRLFNLGEMGRATGWIGRAERLIERDGRDCVERGYLLLPEAHRLIKEDAGAASSVAHRVVEIGERFGDLGLATLGRSIEGRALILLGRHEGGLALLDEAMLAATNGALNPTITGIVYCSVVDCCQKVYAFERAREWTRVLAAWCEEQPQLGTFTGECRVHRSEILQLQGAWGEAIEEAERATRTPAGGLASEAAGAGCYQQAEILRLRGEFEEAEAAYREASRHGREPQPGLALLRLAQGQGEAAAAAIRHVVAATKEPLRRTRYLPAQVEILLAIGDLEGARVASHDLEEIAAGMRSGILDAIASHARGAIRLAEGDAQGALEPLRNAFSIWQQVGAPYLAARLRVLLASALGALGDEEGAGLERDAARSVFRELGAAPDLARLDAPIGNERSGRPFGLTPRELEVLRLVASGRTNRAISRVLFLSEKTIDRHVSNIFTKLDVPSRAAATAFAYQHKLVQE